MEKDYLFFNIITHRVREWDSLSEIEKKAYIKKVFDGKYGEPIEDHYNERASLLPEFARIINVSFGYEKVNKETGEVTWRQYSVHGTDEPELLKKVSAILDGFAAENFAFAGYNVTWFDIPFLTKRFIINGIRIPDSLKRYDKKYWELNDFNLKHVWKFNSPQDTPLETICTSLGIDISDELEIYNLFQDSINDIDFEKVSHLSELRNYLVHAVQKKINNLI